MYVRTTLHVVVIALCGSAILVSSRDQLTIQDLVKQARETPTEELIRQLVELSYQRSVDLTPGESSDQSDQSKIRHKRASFGRYVCPRRTDQSMVYNLQSNPAGYPTEAVSLELFARSQPGSDLLFQCLARALVGNEPVLAPQPVFDNGTTCPQKVSQLWSYNSVANGNTLCWALTSFQETVLYNGHCQGYACLGCDDTFASFDGKLKICNPRYRTVSLWAFCPSLPVDQRIVRDRIIIPSDCSCTTVQCKSSFPFPDIFANWV